jgi:hypothetical protein
MDAASAIKLVLQGSKQMAKTSYDEAALEDGEVRIVHENGRVLELAGEQSNGEWFAYEGDDMVDVLAQGFYERDGDDDVMQDEEGNELARIAGGDEAALLAWAEAVLG